jgi:MoaA/NifB/PqqE/SkfB family radical SAM enzyme
MRRRAGPAVETVLLKQAKHVRRLLLLAARDRGPLPEILQIEATNICNARCVFCPRERMERKQGVMDMALYRRIVDEAAALGIPNVRLHNYGESFIDREIVEKIRYAKSRGIPRLGLISNGSLITEALARGIVEAGLDAINISVDAAGKETFERTRIGLNYDRVIENIERLLRVRGELGAERPKLILSFVRQEDGDEGDEAERGMGAPRARSLAGCRGPRHSNDERAFIEKWSRVADKVHVTDLHNWAGTLHDRSSVQFPCYRPWLTFTVLWDGRVALCCADFDAKVVLGDLRTSAISDVWNSDAFRAIRRAHLDHGGPDICHGCDLPKKDSPLWIRKLMGRPFSPASPRRPVV